MMKLRLVCILKQQKWQTVRVQLFIFIFFPILKSDYRYYEDPSDEFRDEEGTLLPLWKFQYEKTKKMNVTDMCFNTMHYDLFAVCFGSCMNHIAFHIELLLFRTIPNVNLRHIFSFCYLQSIL